LLTAEAIGASLEGVPGGDADAYSLPMRLIPLDNMLGAGDVCAALADRPALEYSIECPVTA
jgi:hypothetical protein